MTGEFPSTLQIFACILKLLALRCYSLLLSGNGLLDTSVGLASISNESLALCPEAPGLSSNDAFSAFRVAHLASALARGGTPSASSAPR